LLHAERGEPWALGDSAACAARIIVVFTTAAEATAAFTLARFLPVSDTRIWLVCPVTRTLLGRLGIERVLRFAKKCAHALPADTLKPIEEFTSAHPLFWFGASTKKSTHIPTTRWRNSWKAVFLRTQEAAEAGRERRTPQK
jgi:hypothetical protein